jgi:hypothetical protein
MPNNPRKPPCPQCGTPGGINQTLSSGTKQYRCYRCSITWTRPEDRKRAGRPKKSSKGKPKPTPRAIRYAIVDFSRGFAGRGLWRNAFVGQVTARSRKQAWAEIRADLTSWPKIQDIKEVDVMPWGYLKAREKRWAEEAQHENTLSEE